LYPPDVLEYKADVPNAVLEFPEFNLKQLCPIAVLSLPVDPVDPYKAFDPSEVLFDPRL
jgi:hypothetical protein